VDDGGPTPNEGLNSSVRSGNPSDTTAPPAVTGLTVTIDPTGNKLDLQWIDLSGTVADLAGYNIYRSTVSGFTPGPSYLLTSTTNSYYNDTGLTDGVTYYYRVAAYDEVPNEGTPSAQAAGTPQDSTPPVQVTGVQVLVKAEGNQLDVQWAPVGGDVAGYRIYRNDALLGTTTNTFYNDSGLVDGQLYTYKIQAYDEVPNYGANSTPASGTPQDTVEPEAVSISTVTPVPTGNALTITWSASTSSDVAGYRLYNSTIQTGPYTLLTTTGAAETSYVHSGLIDGQSYWYKVAPIDEVPNEGANSTAASGVPADTTPPPQVTGLTISVVPTGNELDCQLRSRLRRISYLQKYCIRFHTQCKQ